MHASLNAAQQRAVSTLSGPLLVLAGAGTGKTRVVTYRIARLIDHGVAPDRILAVTFTNKAAAEMQQRVAGLLGKRRPTRPQVSTFHAHCVRILRRHIRCLGFPASFTIFDRGDQESTARSVLRELRLGETALRPGDLLHLISRWKSHGLRPDQAASAAETDKQHLAAAGYRRYQQALKNAGAVDFDDLLLYTQELFARHPEVLDEEAGRFDHVLVDEYQDTNDSQYQIVRVLAAGHRNLCVVGDDDQSIYAWRGANVEHILRFTRDWPDATVVRLESNYRSTAVILEHANRLIRFNASRHEKTLRADRPGGEKPRILQCRTETEEAQTVVQDIVRRCRQPGAALGDIAILFRTNDQPRVFEAELRREKLPYVLVGGTSFFDRKEVRDVLAYLQVIVRPQADPSLLRVLNTPPRGIGTKTVQSFLQLSVQQHRHVWDLLSQAPLPLTLSDRAAAAVRDFVALVTHFQRQVTTPSVPLADLVRQLVQAVGYEAEIQRLYDDPQQQQARWHSVQDVVNALADYEAQAAAPTLREFLDDATLAGREFESSKEDQLRRHAVALMTLHSAKGLEFPYVYMVGMEEGLLPHHRHTQEDERALDEERRLCYVGVTRAQEAITFSLALTRRKWGKPRTTIPSRFLYELTGQSERFANARRRSLGG